MLLLRLCRVVVAVSVLVGAAGAPSSVSAQPNPLRLIWAAPEDAGKIAVERVSSRGGGASETWRLNMDVAIRNDGADTRTLTRIEIGYPDAPVTITSTKYVAGLEIQPGSTAVIQLPENRELPFPVPPVVRATIYFGSKAVVVSRSLTEFTSGVAGGAYGFPGARTDLPDDWYWADNQSHAYGSNHRNSLTQRLAYDFGVRRWNGKAWTTLHPGKSGSKNDHHLIWEMPVYAMADGWILRCYRTINDLDPGDSSGSGSGNGYRIVHAPGEVALYAHMRDDSVPASLCPTEGVNSTQRRAIRVKAGQYLGRVGNTGNSSGPHLHVHLDTTGLSGSDAGQGLPLEFKDVRTLYVGHDWKQAPPCSQKSPRFATTRRAGLGYRQLVEPLYRRGSPELARHRVSGPCFQAFVENAAAAGYRPVWFDGYDVGGKTFVNAIFRPAGSVDWLMRHDLSHSQYQSEITTSLDKGYVPSLVESYRVGDSLRYAFVAEKRANPGVAAYHGRSASEHQKLADDYEARGYTPISVAVVSLKGKLYYTALWEKRSVGSWSLSSQLTSADYQRFLDDNAKAKRRLAYVNAYHHDGKAMFAVVVTSKASNAYAARHELTTDGYQAEYEKWVGQGLRTQVVTGYRSGSSHRFAALWR